MTLIANPSIITEQRSRFGFTAHLHFGPYRATFRAWGPGAESRAAAKARGYVARNRADDERRERTRRTHDV